MDSGGRDVTDMTMRGASVTAAEALKFFAWSYAKGDKMAEDLDYVPMPDKVVGAIKKAGSAQMKDKDGKPLIALSN